MMFREALTASSQRRFREVVKGEGDIQMQWLLSSLRVSMVTSGTDGQVERWREALLWTYVVGNLGAVNPAGVWGEEARAELKDMFGLGETDDDVIKIEVHRGERWTLESGRMERAFEQAGWEAPKATHFLFCESLVPQRGRGCVYRAPSVHRDSAKGTYADERSLTRWPYATALETWIGRGDEQQVHAGLG
jgi:hypothetical protein